MCSNMQELKQYVASNRKTRAFQHYELNKIHGECQPINDREYKLLPITGKRSYNQVKKHTNHAYWRGKDEKFDLKQLKKVIL